MALRVNNGLFLFASVTMPDSSSKTDMDDTSRNAFLCSSSFSTTGSILFIVGEPQRVSKVPSKYYCPILTQQTSTNKALYHLHSTLYYSIPDDNRQAMETNSVDKGGKVVVVGCWIIQSLETISNANLESDKKEYRYRGSWYISFV